MNPANPLIEQAMREKLLAAAASVGSALVLVALKIFLTTSTGSLGVLSEALHSSLDLIAAVITFLSVRVSDRPPDSSHTYGHAKIESFAAFVETFLLLLTALYIIYEAVHRVFFHDAHIRPTVVSFLILLLCLAIDVVRSRALTRVAHQYQSEALEADALHFSTDVWSTAVVILGLAAVAVGERFGLRWLGFADPIAALVVAGVVIRVGWQLGRRTMDALVDAAPSGLQQRIASTVSKLDGVLATERVRVRRVGKRHFVDVTISVPRTATFDQVHAISDTVERRVEEIVPADVMVHMEPRAHANEGVFDRIRAIAQRRGQAIHEISANQLGSRLYVELHLEVDESLTLRSAHRAASELERDILAEVPEAAEVYIHIEPLGTHIASGDTMQDLGAAVQAFTNSLRADFRQLLDCHQVHVRRVERKILVSCHCTMEGQLPITEVHDVTAALENRVREHFPQISRITIHPEPPGEN
ncbi:MAG: cation-efflux pump [Acidipila sp.]|nr:cation-efflux pump [Acidipila sp.]